MDNSLDIPLDLHTGWYINVDAEDYEIPYLKANPGVAYVRHRVETARSGTVIAFVRVTFACLRYADLSSKSNGQARIHPLQNRSISHHQPR